MTVTLSTPGPDEPPSEPNVAALDAQMASYARSHRAAVSTVARTMPAVGTAIHAALVAHLDHTDPLNQAPGGSHAAV